MIHIRHGLMAINWLISCRKVSPWSILVKLLTCVILGKGNSKIMNLIRSSLNSPSFLYIPNNEKTSRGPPYLTQACVCNLTQGSPLLKSSLYFCFEGGGRRRTLAGMVCTHRGGIFIKGFPSIHQDL